MFLTGSEQLGLYLFFVNPNVALHFFVFDSLIKSLMITCMYKKVWIEELTFMHWKSHSCFFRVVELQALII